MTVSCVEWAAKPLLKGWQICSGMGGSFAVESVAALPWNGWQLCYGISGSFAAEYSATDTMTLIDQFSMDLGAAIHAFALGMQPPNDPRHPTQRDYSSFTTPPVD